jgi:hypothetical protein
VTTKRLYHTQESSGRPANVPRIKLRASTPMLDPRSRPASSLSQHRSAHGNGGAACEKPASTRDLLVARNTGSPASHQHDADATRGACNRNSGQTQRATSAPSHRLARARSAASQQPEQKKEGFGNKSLMNEDILARPASAQPRLSVAPQRTLRSSTTPLSTSRVASSLVGSPLKQSASVLISDAAAALAQDNERLQQENEELRRQLQGILIVRACECVCMCVHVV